MLAGLGGIYVSACDDASSIYHNPAGIAWLNQAEFTAQYSRLYAGLSDNSNLGYSFLGVAQPLGKNAGALGIGWLRFALAGLYSEDTMMLTYARDGSFLNKGWKDVSFGVNLKYLKIAYGQDQYTMNALDNNGNATGAQDSLFATYGNTKGNIDADLGVQYKISYNYKLGLMIENLSQPNLALQSDVFAPLWTTYKFGITHTGKTSLQLIDFMFKQFDGSSDWQVATGGEKQVSDNIALRGALDIGSRELVDISCGIGYKIDNFQIDYAMVYPISGIQGTLGDQRISVIFRFGPVIHKPENTEKLMKQYNEEKQARMETENKLQEANTELARLRKALKIQLSKPAPVVPVVAAITKKPVPETVLAPKTTVQVVVPVTSVKAATVQKAPVATVTTAQYLRELNQYRKTANETSIPQRLRKVDEIIKKYGAQLNVTEAQQEHTVLVDEQKAQEKYFKDSLDYYRNMASYGIKREEKMDILKRMINKYKTMGINVSEAQNELDKIGGE